MTKYEEAVRAQQRLRHFGRRFFLSVLNDDGVCITIRPTCNDPEASAIVRKVLRDNADALADMVRDYMQKLADEARAAAREEAQEILDGLSSNASTQPLPQYSSNASTQTTAEEATSGASAGSKAEGTAGHAMTLYRWDEVRTWPREDGWCCGPRGERIYVNGSATGADDAKLGDGVWVGARATVGDGSAIGDRVAVSSGTKVVGAVHARRWETP